MQIDDSILLMYAAYKVGSMCGVLCLLSLVAILISLPIASEGRESGERIAMLIWLLSAILLVIAAPIATLAPNLEDVKAYAVYRIGSDVANSEEAKRLIEGALNMLENKR